jgi:hypothetical protein
MSAIFIISVVFIWWYAISIKYVYYEGYLLVQGIIKAKDEVTASLNVFKYGPKTAFYIGLITVCAYL